MFEDVIDNLEAALPTVEFGFGVGRFEDYNQFPGRSSTGRPCILNQPIATSVDAGGDVARDGIISAALSWAAPGFGGDSPESAIAEGLLQVAEGIGFDGNGDGEPGTVAPCAINRHAKNPRSAPPEAKGEGAP